MRIPAVRNSPKDGTTLNDNYWNKIVLMGCAPAWLPCTTFLARLGYKDLTIFQKQDYLGGFSSLEISQYRLSYDHWHHEQQHMKWNEILMKQKLIDVAYDHSFYILIIEKKFILVDRFQTKHIFRNKIINNFYRHVINKEY